MTTTELPGRVDLSEHGIDASGQRLPEPDDLAALHARAARGDGRARRGRPARRRHRHVHGPLAEGQVPRRRGRLAGPHLVGRGQPAARPRSTSTACATKVDGAPRRPTTLYVVDAWAGADPAHRIGVRVITAHPYHALFATTMFIDLAPTRSSRASRPRRSSCTRPTSRPTRTSDGTRAGTFVVLHPGRTELLIGGTFYAGEIKKSIFTVMNDRLPLEGVFPMHCSANVGDDGRRRGLLRPLGHRQDDAVRRPRAVADRRRRARLGRQRRLQHRGRLLREGDPPLGRGRAGDLRDDAARSGRSSRTSRRRARRRLDLDDDSKTENTRAAYKLEQISNALPAKLAGHPRLGRLPDRRRLRDPAADRAADARAGALLLPLRLHREARRHRDRRHRAAADVLDLLRPARSCRSRRRSTRGCSARSSTSTARPSGSSTPAGPAGPFGEGQPDADPATRAMLHAALSGELDGVELRTDEVFGFQVPVAVPGVDSSCSTRARPGRDPTPTTRKARELAADVRRRTSRSASSDVDDGDRAPPGPRLWRLSRAGAARSASVLRRGGDPRRPGRRRRLRGHARGHRGVRRRRERRASISKLHPTRSHSGAAEGGINAALGNAAEDSPESHAFDTVKGSDYIGDQDAIEIFTREAPGDIYQLEHWGAVFSRARRRQARAAPVRRRRLAAHRLRRRHHRPRADPGALRAAREARHHGLRGVLRLEARRGRRPLPGRHLLGPAERRPEGGRRQDGRARDRRRRAASTARRRTRTPAPATARRWRSGSGCR